MAASSSKRQGTVATGAVTLIAFAMAAFTGCSRRAPTPPPAVDDTGYRGAASEPAPCGSYRDVQGRRHAIPRPPQPPMGAILSGLTTTQKLVVLGGAAALYYMYKKHQHAQADTGPDGQYYLSKNGRVYYRDAEHRAHWVTPPPDGIAVPADEAAAYRDLQGYENRPTGRRLEELAPDQAY